jgi:hypothetical protein
MYRNNYGVVYTRVISWLIQNNRYRHFKVNRKWGKIDDNDYDYD